MLEFDFVERLNQIREKEERERLRELHESRAREQTAKNLALSLQHLGQAKSTFPSVEHEGDTVTMLRGNSKLAVFVIGNGKFRVVLTGNFASSNNHEPITLEKTEMMDEVIKFYSRPLKSSTN